MNTYSQNPGLAAIPSSVWGGAFEEVAILVRSAVSGIVNLTLSVRDAYVARAAMRELRGLDDRMLADIGFARLPDGNVVQILRK
jgi:hypothetical protein